MKGDGMTERQHHERIGLVAAAPRQAAALIRFGTTDLDPTIAELIKMRASQLNGCAYCIDMHWQDARAAGEEETRLYLLDAWRESPGYSARERAALALCESVTVLERGGVPDPIWDEAATHFGEAELAQLLCAIAAINAWNRLMIASRGELGHYQPADRAAMREAAAAEVADPVTSEAAGGSTEVPAEPVGGEAR
jgi:AhpD family alkylhydroperoxidase